MLFGIALDQQLDALDKQPRRAVQVISALAVLQFVALFTLPSRFIPSWKAHRQAQQFLEQMAATPGDIFVINGAADLSPAHKASFANALAVWDIVRTRDCPASQGLIADIQQSIQQQHYAALLAPSLPLGADAFVGAPVNLSSYYKLNVAPLYTGETKSELETLQNPGLGPVYLFPVVRH
jgi:hypothetical protein